MRMLAIHPECVMIDFSIVSSSSPSVLSSSGMVRHLPRMMRRMSVAMLPQLFVVVLLSLFSNVDREEAGRSHSAVIK